MSAAADEESPSMDKQRNSYNGRFGEAAPGSRRPTGS